MDRAKSYRSFGYVLLFLAPLVGLGVLRFGGQVAFYAARMCRS